VGDGALLLGITSFLSSLLVSLAWALYYKTFYSSKLPYVNKLDCLPMSVTFHTSQTFGGKAGSQRLPMTGSTLVSSSLACKCFARVEVADSGPSNGFPLCHHACPHLGYRGKPDLFPASAARPIDASALADCRQVPVPGSSNCKKAGRSVRFLQKINLRMKTFVSRNPFKFLNLSLTKSRNELERLSLACG